MTDGDRMSKGTIELDGCDTIIKLWARRCGELGGATAHREKQFGIWQSYSWQDWYEGARKIGVGLMALGLNRGEPVQILAEDRREWLYCDLGIAGVGGIPTGVYTTDSATQLAYLVEDSGARFLFVENDEQLDKFLELRDRMAGLEKVIVFDRDGLRKFTDPKVMFLDELMALGQKEIETIPGRFEAELERAGPEDIRMLIYTSGTTGPPKGAMISHRNMLYQLQAGLQILDYLPGDQQLCFLPLCHVLERLVSVENPIAVGSTVNFAESPETVFENLQEVSPHVFTAVPRLWEKIYSRVMIMRGEATWIGRKALDLALAMALARQRVEEEGGTPSLALRCGHSLADLLVLRNLRNLLGMSRMRRGTTGAAPISPDLIRWYCAIGVELIEGYGMTETSGVATANRPGANRIGSVGPALPGCELRISGQGEILVHGPNVFGGYWKKPDKTSETIDKDGWMHTGDVGRLDNSGCLTITGRVKDIIITAGGKNITPAELESRLKFSPYISDAVIIGDRRKYLTALIMIDQENVEKFAQDRRVPFSDFASLTRAEPVVDLIGELVREVNREFARVEQIKDFRLIDILLTAEDEELTPTMKLKRSFVETRHRALIDAMY